MAKKKPCAPEAKIKKQPSVEASRTITLTLPDAGYGYGGRYDIHFSLNADEAIALSDQLRAAADEYRKAQW